MDSYWKNGIKANQVSENEGNNLSITYDGLLYTSGADTIYAYYGYGTRWTNKSIVKMAKTDNGFYTQIPLSKSGTMNMVFKDSAENWDNNSGENYSFVIKVK